MRICTKLRPKKSLKFNVNNDSQIATNKVFVSSQLGNNSKYKKNKQVRQLEIFYSRHLKFTQHVV